MEWNWDIDLDYLLKLIYQAIEQIYGAFTISFKDYHFVDGVVLFFSAIVVDKLIDLFFHHGNTEAFYEDWVDDDDFDG